MAQLGPGDLTVSNMGDRIPAPRVAYRSVWRETLNKKSDLKICAVKVK